MGNSSKGGKSGKRGKRRVFNPVSNFADTLLAASRTEVKKEDLDLLFIPALAQVACLSDGGKIEVEGFTLLNEANCVVYCLSNLLWTGARCDNDAVRGELREVCQSALDKAENSAKALAEIAEGFKMTGELRATPEQVEAIKISVHSLKIITQLATTGAFFKAMKDASKMVDLALKGGGNVKSAA